MEILLCQSCGSILRGKSRYCTGCGISVSSHALTAISSQTAAAPPLTVSPAVDPLVIERAMGRRRVAMLAGGGNGGNGVHESSSVKTNTASLPDPGSASSEAYAGDRDSALGSALKGISKDLSPVPNSSDAYSLLSLDDMPQADPGVKRTEEDGQALETKSELDPPGADVPVEVPVHPGSPAGGPVFSPRLPLPFLPRSSSFLSIFSTMAQAGSTAPLPDDNNRVPASASFNSLPDSAPGTTDSTDAFSSSAAFPLPPGLPGNAGAEQAAIAEADSLGSLQFLPVFPAPALSRTADNGIRAQSEDGRAADEKSFAFEQALPGDDIAADKESSGLTSGFDFFNAPSLPAAPPLDKHLQGGPCRSVAEALSNEPASALANQGSELPAANQGCQADSQAAAVLEPPVQNDAQSPADSVSFFAANCPASAIPPATAMAGAGKADDGETLSAGTSQKIEPDAGKTCSRQQEASSSSPAQGEKGGKSGIARLIDFFADLNGECCILGKSLRKKQVLVCAVVAAFIGFQILAVAAGSLTGSTKAMLGALTGQAPAPYPLLSGTWEVAYQIAGQQRVYPGTMRIVQNGSNFAGEGQDVAYYQLRGTFTPPKIIFNKQYVNNGAPVGKPIVYEGNVTVSRAEPPAIDGIFIAPVRKGVFATAHWEEMRGRWQAQMVVDKSAAAGQDPGKVGAGWQPAVQAGAVSEPAHDAGGAVGIDLAGLYLKVAVGIIFVCVLLAMASLKLFGPAGMINIWHKREYIPSQFKTPHKKLLKELGKPLRPGGLPLGLREDWNVTKIGQPKELHLSPELRDQNPHMLVIGAGAKGKTRLIANMITNDISSGDRAVVVIDSDGHLVDLVLRWLASHPKGQDYARRVLVIDPTSKEGCAAYNPLESPADNDFQAAASAVVYGFKAIYTEPPGSQSQWNQQTANILRNAALLLMANGKTLTDLPRLLGDNDFRDELLENIEKRRNERVEFITLLDQWANYKKLARTDQWITWTEPILNRVTPMLGDPRIRPILTKPHSDLCMREIITGHQVLLLKIPQGQLDQNATLLGSLLVTGLKQAAMSLSVNSTRKHFTALYIDEFDNFIEKETFDALTSDTRKFQIGFTAAIKTMQHLPEDFRNQLVINVGTVCAFSLAKKDADMLGPQMFRVDGRKIKHQTIQNVFNKVNTSPQFELISDEEKLNIDRLVGQEERTYFCYRVGTVAGVFHMKAHEFKDIADKEVNWSLISKIYGNKKGEMVARAAASS